MLLRLILLLALVLPLSAFAQSLDLSGNTSPFSLSISPQYPAPYSLATLSLVSGTVDLAAASVAVSVGGKEVYKGSAKPLAIPLGRVGGPVRVQVRVTAGGTPYTQTVEVTPQDVSLIAEPIASAPVLYPGSPLVPLEGSVRMVAVSNLRTNAGKAVNSATCSYQWTIDGAMIANGSGIGKEALTVAVPLQYRERTVSVSVTSADGTLVGGASASFTGNDPSVRIYENDPLLGIRFDHAVASSYTIAGTESSLYAAPFSFPIAAGAPVVQWFLNGELVETGNSVTLRPTGQGQGNASLSLVAASGDFSKALASLSLSFGATSGFHLFGL